MIAGCRRYVSVTYRSSQRRARRCIEPALKEKLSELKKLRKEQTAALKTGSQKAFFSRVWERLHGQEKAAEEQAAKAAADEKSKQEESSSGDCNNEIKASASVDEMSRDSIQATPISSPVFSLTIGPPLFPLLSAASI